MSFTRCFRFLRFLFHRTIRTVAAKPLTDPTGYAPRKHRKETNLNELHLFAGAGGGILGGMLLGHTCVCAVEIEEYPRRVLLQRQRDGILPRFPIWDDVQTFDGTPWRGRVDVVCGGFPCQDISAAGKGAGIDGERSGLWGEMARIVGEIRPRFVFVENSPMLVGRGLTRVLGDLAEMGYDAKWCVLGADDAGARHHRKRIWLLAHAARIQQGREKQRAEWERTWASSKSIDVADAQGQRCIWQWNAEPRQPREFKGCLWSLGESWLAEPRVGRVANGVADRVDRLKGLGNGQVPECAALAWKLLSA